MFRSGIKKAKNHRSSDNEGQIPLLENPSQPKQNQPQENKANVTSHGDPSLCHSASYKPSLLKALFKTYWLYYLLFVVASLLMEIPKFIGPVLLRYVLCKDEYISYSHQ